MENRLPRAGHCALWMAWPILLLCGWHSVAQADQLRLVTGELPPYATRERADEGLALDIVRKAFANVGTTVSYTFKPWTRSLEEARAGLWDGTAHWGKNPERDTGFLISDNILTEQWVLLYRQRAYGGDKSRGALKVELAQDDLGNLRRLVAGRVDVAVIERNVACYLMQTHFKPTEVARLRVHPKLLSNQFTTHLMLSDKLPQSAERMRAFNQGLAQLKKSKDYAALLQYPPAVWPFPTNRWFRVDLAPQ